MNYLILGLPRSRTAWMASFLSDNKTCIHEGVFYMDYKELLKDSRIDGDSTTCYPFIKDCITNEKIVIIDRDIDECFESSKRLFDKVDYDSFASLKNDLNKLDGLKIKFNEINDSLKRIWDYCKGSDFNSKRADKMKSINIQNNRLIDCIKAAL